MNKIKISTILMMTVKKQMLLGILFATICFFSITTIASANTFDNENNFVSQLGIYTITSPQAPVTRGEVADTIIHILNLQNTIPKSTVRYYNDVTLDSPFADSIKYLRDINVMVGVDENRFAPTEPITKEQLMVIMVNALNYKTYAELNGGMPFGYAMTASKLKLHIPEEVNQETFATTIYRVLLAPYNKLSGVKENFEEYTDKETVLSIYHKLEVKTGIIISSGEQSFLPQSNVSNDEIMLDNDMIFEVGKTDIAKLLGYKVTIYYNEDNVILGYLASKNTDTLTLSPEMIESVKDNVITYYTDDKQTKTEKAKISTNASYTLNGSYASKLNDTELDVKFGKLLLIDNSKEGTYQFVIAESYETYIVDSVAIVDNTIATKANGAQPSNKLVLNQDKTYVTVNGTPSTLDALKEYDVIWYGRTKALSGTENQYKYIINASRKSISGAVSENSDDYIKMGDKTYKKSSIFTTAVNFDENAIFYLDLNDDIAFKNVQNSGLLYGFLFKVGEEKGIDGCVQFKMLNANGKVAIVNVAKKIWRFNCSTGVGWNSEKINSTDVLDANKPAAYLNTSEPIRIAYKLNSDQEIVAIGDGIVFNWVSGRQYIADGNYLGNGGSQAGSAEYFAKDAMVFRTPENDADKNEYDLYSVVPYKQVFSNTSWYDGLQKAQLSSVIDSKRNSYCYDFIQMKVPLQNGAGVMVVVTSLGSVINNNDEEADKVIMAIDNSKTSYVTYHSDSLSGVSPLYGDVLDMVLRDNMIYRAEKILDTTKSWGYFNKSVAKGNYTAGTITDIKDDIIKIESLGSPVRVTNSAQIVICDLDKSDKTLVNAKFGDMQVGDKILFRTASEKSADFFVIYRNWR